MSFQDSKAMLAIIVIIVAAISAIITTTGINVPEHMNLRWIVQIK